MLLLLKILGIAIALFCLDRLCLYLERRGWMYYRRRKPSGGAIGNVFLEMQSFVQPSIRDVIEHRQEEEVQARGEVGDVLRPEAADKSAQWPAKLPESEDVEDAGAAPPRRGRGGGGGG